MGVWYATREQVKASVDIKNSLRANAQIDRIIADASRSADLLCRRTFYPRFETRRWRSPTEDSPTPGVLWLGGQSEIIELLSIDDAGHALDLADVRLDPETGPPYTRLCFSDGRTGAGTYRAKLGYGDDQTPVGTVASPGGISSFDTTVLVADGSLIGVGALLACDTERMTVVDRRPADTGLTITTTIADKMNIISINLSSATAAPNPGEMILIDGERMLVQDRTGTTCFVNRAVDGTVLAEHTAGAAVYAYRSLTVRRGEVGTTAVIQPQGSELTAYVPHPTLSSYVVAETLNQLAQENSAYARVIGSGENQREARGSGIKDKRDRLRRDLGRRVRMGAI